MTILRSRKQNQVIIDLEFPASLLDMEKRLKKKLPGMMRRIAMEGKSFWKAEAGRKLKSSRNAYMKAIDFEVIDNLSFYIKLEGYLPYSVENGRQGFDMKPGFLKNANKVSKTGSRYRVIPLNVNRYINMTKPTTFATVSDNSAPSSWMHPGWKGMKLADEVVKELGQTIIPKNIEKLFKDLEQP